MAKGSRALANCRIVLAGFSHSERNQAGKWISNLGGAHSSTVNGHTTHVIASEKAWKDVKSPVQLALKENEHRAGQNDKKTGQIKIVSMTWIEDSSTNKVKKGEGPYLWEKIQSKKKSGAKGSEMGAKSHQGMLKETVLGCTEQYVDEAEQKRQDREIRMLEVEEQMRKMEEEAKKRKEQAEIFKKGAMKAKHHIFSENHHIYTDETGFKYDIFLTKVDTRTNRNERYALTIQLYESNAEPHTYATNLQFAGTGILPSNNLLAAIGCNFPTAFHVFQDAFLEKTGVQWDDRVAYAFRRIVAEKAARGLATGGESSEVGSRKGVPVQSEVVKNVEGRPKRMEKSFEDMLFEYNPPRLGARGTMSEEKEEEVKNLIGAEEMKKDGMGTSGRRGSHEKVEAWMSGAISVGGGPKAQPAPSRVLKDTEAIDLTADGDFDFGNGPPAVANSATIGAEMNQTEFEDILDDTYPFNQDYSEHFGLNTNDTTDAVGQEPDAIVESNDMADVAEARGGELDISFDTAPTDAATRAEISFDQPPSVVLESFQPGTQEVGETQIAEKAKGKFEEAMNHEELVSANANGAGTGENMANGNGAGTAAAGLNKGLKLGGSILGKRKKAEAGSENKGESVAMDWEAKKMKRDGGEGEVSDMLDLTYW